MKRLVGGIFRTWHVWFEMSLEWVPSTVHGIPLRNQQTVVEIYHLHTTLSENAVRLRLFLGRGYISLQPPQILGISVL